MEGLGQVNNSSLEGIRALIDSSRFQGGIEDITALLFLQLEVSGWLRWCVTLWWRCWSNGGSAASIITILPHRRLRLWVVGSIILIRGIQKAVDD